MSSARAHCSVSDAFLNCRKKKKSKLSCFRRAEPAPGCEGPVALLHEECQPTSNETAALRPHDGQEKGTDGGRWAGMRRPPDRRAWQESVQFGGPGAGTGAV